MDDRAQKKKEIIIEMLHEATANFPAIVRNNEGIAKIIDEALKCCATALNKEESEGIKLICPYFLEFSSREYYRGWELRKVPDEYRYISHKSMDVRALEYSSIMQRVIADNLNLGTVADHMVSYKENGKKSPVAVILDAIDSDEIGCEFCDEEASFHVKVPKIEVPKPWDNYSLYKMSQDGIQTEDSPFGRVKKLNYRSEEISRFNEDRKGEIQKVTASIGEKCITSGNKPIINLANRLLPYASYLVDEHNSFLFIFSDVVRYDAIKNSETLGLGGTFVVMEKDIIDKSMLGTLSGLSDKLAIRVVHDYQHRLILDTTKKAAISQVVNRNLSHNIGSHVLSRLSTESHLKKVFKEVKDEKDIMSRIATLNSYLKDRMEFIADIATTASPVGFSMTVHEMVDNFEHNDLLVNRIVGNEKKVAKIRKPQDEDALVSITNGSLGTQAFYTILENLMRNSAKHGSGKEVHVYMSDLKGAVTHWKLTISDEENVINQDENVEEFIKKQNEKINASILDEERDELREGAWGLLEMKVAAAYLRKMPIDKIDDKHEKMPLLKCVPRGKNERGKPIFGYELYLPMPNECLVICEGEIDRARKNKLNELSKFGIKIVPKAEFEKSVKGGEIYDHEIIVAEKSMDILGNPIYSKRISARILLLDECGVHKENIKVKILDWVGSRQESKESESDWLSSVWQGWLHKLSNQDDANPVNLVKLDDGDKRGEITIPAQPDSNSVGSLKEAYFALHGEKMDEKEMKSYEDECNKKGSYFERYGSLDLLSRLIGKLIGKIGVAEENVAGKKNFKLHAMFLEAVNYKISIIDERIQEYAELESKDNSDKNIKYMKLCGLKVPPSNKINLSGENFRSVEGQLKEWIRDNCKEDKFIVIHLGIIERLHAAGNTATSKSKKDYARNFLGELCLNNVELILVSGRGRPDSLPEDECFLQYANMERFIVSEPSKLHLVQALMSARSAKMRET